MSDSSLLRNQADTPPRCVRRDKRVSSCTSQNFELVSLALGKGRLNHCSLKLARFNSAQNCGVQPNIVSYLVKSPVSGKSNSMLCRGRLTPNSSRCKT